MNDILWEGRDITKTFHSGFGGRSYQALAHVDLALHRGETLGLMGPSGCGKSTLCRILLRLIEPDQGQILFGGQDITHAKGKELLSFRRRVQLISQRPESFFDPRFRLGDSILEPLSFYGISKTQGRQQLQQLLDEVKLTDELLTRYPHQVSGGEIQRLSLCRALLLSPQVLVLDEPTSMLDVSVQAQILHILRRLRERHGLSYLFITHDREAAAYLCHRIQKLEAPGS